MKNIQTCESIIFIPIQMFNEVLSFRKQKFGFFKRLLSLLKVLYKKDISQKYEIFVGCHLSTGHHWGRDPHQGGKSGLHQITQVVFNFFLASVIITQGEKDCLGCFCHRWGAYFSQLLPKAPPCCPRKSNMGRTSMGAS